MYGYVRTSSETVHLIEDYGPAVAHAYCGREFDRDEHDLVRTGDVPDDACGHCEKAR